MAGVDFPSLPTFNLDAGFVTSRNAEYPDTPFDDLPGDDTFDDPYLGVNRGGSCAPGIGLHTGEADSKDDDWTTLDQGPPVESGGSQTPQARDPQASQHIGGEAFVDRTGGFGDDASSGGTEGLTTVTDLQAVQAFDDLNDTLTLIEAVVQAAPGVGMGTANADPINRTGVTVEIGEKVWGTNTVA